MPHFDCHVLPLMSLPVDAGGIKEPLCNDCTQNDCDNPIRRISLTILGKKVSWRLWSVNNQLRQVIQCDGYINKQDDQNVEL